MRSSPIAMNTQCTALKALAASFLLSHASAQTFTGEVELLRPLGIMNLVEARDLDGDGRDDLLVTGNGPNTISWWRGTEDDGFVREQTILGPTGTNVGAIDAADLDGDGDLDIVAGEFAADSLYWIENLGEGAFGPPNVLPPPGYRLRDIELADLDGDGDLDVLYVALDLGSAPSRLEWRENLGAGAFGPARSLSLSVDRYIDSVVADLDGDGDLDILVSNEAAHEISLHENMGGGNFGPKTLASSAFIRPTQLALSDVDGDGDLDLFSLGVPFGGEVSWIRNLGNGLFGSSRQPVFSTSLALNDVTPIDVDGDGLDDLALSLGTEGRYGWMRNVGGSFGPMTDLLDRGAYSSRFTVGDFDVDGDLDLINASRSQLLLNRSDGMTLQAAELVSIDIEEARSASLADLDGDGDADLILALSIADDGFAWSENLGGGAFEGPTQIFAQATALDCRPLDLDGDGDLDLVSAGGSFDTFQASVRWAENLGQGQFADSVSLYARIADSGASAAYGDMDGDGDLDIFVSHREVVSFSYFHQWVRQGPGGFFLGPEIPDSLVSPDNELADMDGDGNADLVFAGGSNARIAWRQNLGNGTLGAQTVIAPQAAPTVLDFQVTDLDGDGDSDVVAGGHAGTVLYRNQGPGTFAGGVSLDGVIATVVLVRDVDQDGRPDLLLSRFGGRATWLRNLGAGSFAAAVPLPGFESTAVAVGDLDGDLDLDVLKRQPDGGLAFNPNMFRIGEGYCGLAEVHSGGESGAITASGSLATATNDLRLRVERLPSSTFGFFLIADAQGFAANPGGSQGNLCLGGNIGRLIRSPGDIFSTNAAGSADVPLDLTAVPTPQGTSAVAPGDTRFAQAWFRDMNPGVTSNFTNGLVLEFQ